MNASPPTWAASLLALAALLPIGTWLILLFVAQTPAMSVIDAALQTVEFTFAEQNQNRLWFVWWGALPVVLLLLAAAYFSRISRRASGAKALFGASVLVALTALYFAPAFLIVLAFPLYFGFVCIRQARHVG